MSGMIPGTYGDGVHDDRAAIQAAIDAAAAAGGSDVHLPAGTYLVSPAAGYRCLTLHGGVRLFSTEGAVLAQGPTAGPSVRLLYVTGEGCIVQGLGLDGSRAPRDGDEHRAGIFADGVISLKIIDCTSGGFTGDGIYLYRATDVAIRRTSCTDNGRNGLTLGGTVTGVTIDDCTFERNGAQQVDSEPGGTNVVSCVTLRRCLLSSAPSGDYALTISGSSSSVPGHTWRVEHCDIRGNVFVVWAEDVVIGWSSLANLTVQRSSSRVRVLGCDLAHVKVEGTAGSGPSSVLLAGNRVTDGVEIRGAESADLLGNTIAGGVYLRDTVAGRVAQVSLRSNQVDSVTSNGPTPGLVNTDSVLSWI